MHACQRTAVGLVCTFLGVALGTHTFAADDLSGIWKLRTSFQGRSGRALILDLAVDGDRLKGTAMRSEDVVSEIENGRLRDGKLSFDVVSEWNGRRRVTEFTGSLEGTTLRGTAKTMRRGESRVLDWVGTRTSRDALREENQAPTIAADIDLRDGNYQVWRDHILPAAEELAWAKIPWLTTFKDGIKKSAEDNKPLLLWTMNGHPLGCT